MKRINSVSKTTEGSYIVFFTDYTDKKARIRIKANAPFKFDYLYRASFDSVGLHYRKYGCVKSFTTDLQPQALVHFARFAYKNEIKKYKANKEDYEYRR